MKKVFVTLSNTEYLPYVKNLENCARKAGKWDGDFVNITVDSEFVKIIPGNPSIHFYKMFLFHEYFHQWDWIFYCDLDVLFINEIDLELDKRDKNFIYANTDDLSFKEQFSVFPPELEHLSKNKTFQSCYLLFNNQFIDEGYFKKLFDDYLRYSECTHPLYKDQSILNNVFIDKWKELGDKFVNKCPVLDEVKWDISRLEDGYYDNTDYSDKIAIHFTPFFQPWNQINTRFYPLWKEYTLEIPEVKSGQFAEYDDGGHIMSIKCYTNGHKDCELDVTEGEHSYNHGDGNVWQEYTIWNGKPHGKWTRYHLDGKVSIDEEYSNGIKVGHWTSWHDNGTQWKEENYKDGKKDGVFKSWRYDGTIDYEGQYENDREVGDWIYYYHNGKEKEKGFYRDGVRVGKWVNFYETRDREDSFGQSGELHYTNGKLNGKYTEWNGSGRRIVNGQYKDGEMEGTWTYWYEEVDKDSEVKCKLINYNKDKMHGVFKEWHSDGSLWKDFKYRNGKLHGKYKKYRRDGSKYYVGQYKYGRRIDDWVYYYHNDVKKREEFYNENEHLDGVVITYHFADTEIKFKEKTYVDGELHGVSKKWKEDGSIEYEIYYKNDKRDGDWKYYHASPAPFKRQPFRKIVTYKDDIPIGKSRKWYKNGKLMEEKNYKNGKLEGKYQEFFVNGQQRSSGKMNNDLMQGKWTYWYHNGKKEFECTLDSGSPVGNAKIWFDNGTLKGEIKL
jgi:antitoxin component YwqK of YwqJK toxin-antitoxin module